MCANKKIQDISMKAAIGNHQILGLPIVSQRQKAVIGVYRLITSNVDYMVTSKNWRHHQKRTHLLLN